MRILVTGSTGFIGSAFVRLALRQGHEVAGLIRPEKKALAEGFHQNCRCVLGSVERPPWKEIESFRPEACVHAAWITTPGVYLDSPENERLRDASVQFLSQLPEFDVQQIVALGTCIEYEITNKPLSEANTRISPTTTYARCKNELRLAMESEARRRGIKFCWGRVFYPYGPGEHPSRLCSSVFHSLSTGEKVVLKTPNSVKDYIYIEDLASALLILVEAQYAGTINLGTGTGVSVHEIARCVGTLLNRPNLIELADQADPDAFPFVVADATRLKQHGWSPKWALRRGLEQMVKNWNVHGGAAGSQ